MIRYNLENIDGRETWKVQDSLTLKLEGLLRDLCELNKINTFYFTKDKLVLYNTSFKSHNIL